MKLKEILLGAMFGIESFIGMDLPNSKGYFHQTTVYADCLKEGLNKQLIFDGYRRHTGNASEFITIREKGRKPFGAFVIKYNTLIVDKDHDGKVDYEIDIDQMNLLRKNVCHYIPK